MSHNRGLFLSDENTWHSSPFLPRCRSRRALAEAWQGHAPCWASTTAAADWQRPQRACSRQFHVDTARIAKSCRGRHDDDRHREIMMRTQYLWLLEKERNSDGAQQRPQVTLVLRRSRSTSALAMRQPVAEPVTANPPELSPCILYLFARELSIADCMRRSRSR